MNSGRRAGTPGWGESASSGGVGDQMYTFAEGVGVTEFLFYKRAEDSLKR